MSAKASTSKFSRGAFDFFVLTTSFTKRVSLSSDWPWCSMRWWYFLARPPFDSLTWSGRCNRVEGFNCVPNPPFLNFRRSVVGFQAQFSKDERVYAPALVEIFKFQKLKQLLESCWNINLHDSKRFRKVIFLILQVCRTTRKLWIDERVSENEFFEWRGIPVQKAKSNLGYALDRKQDFENWEMPFHWLLIEAFFEQGRRVVGRGADRVNQSAAA